MSVEVKCGSKLGVGAANGLEYTCLLGALILMIHDFRVFHPNLVAPKAGAMGHHIDSQMRI